MTLRQLDILFILAIGLIVVELGMLVMAILQYMERRRERGRHNARDGEDYPDEETPA